MWNGVYFCSVLAFANRMFRPEVVLNQERLVSIMEPHDSSFLTRVTLDASGNLIRHKMNAIKDKQNLVFTNPQETCDEYGLCGPNGICKIDKPIRCECLKGFVPKFQRDRDHPDWSGGCTRTTPLDCQRGDGFLKVRHVKFLDMLSFLLNTSMSLSECQAKCFKNCSCTAYANPFITDGGRGYVMWFGDLIDTREHSGADGKQKIYIRGPVSELVDGEEVQGLLQGLTGLREKFLQEDIQSGSHFFSDNLNYLEKHINFVNHRACLYFQTGKFLQSFRLNCIAIVQKNIFTFKKETSLT